MEKLVLTLVVVVVFVSCFASCSECANGQSEQTVVGGGGSAFPKVHNDYQYAGMTLRQYAAIRLRVPNSGEDWLDDMIQESRRLDLGGTKGETR